MARAQPPPGRRPANAPQGCCRRPRPGPVGHPCRRRRRGGHAGSRWATTGTAGRELRPRSALRAGSTLRLSAWRRGPAPRPWWGRSLWGGPVRVVGGAWPILRGRGGAGRGGEGRGLGIRGQEPGRPQSLLDPAPPRSGGSDGRTQGQTEERDGFWPPSATNRVPGADLIPHSGCTDSASGPHLQEETSFHMNGL